MDNLLALVVVLCVVAVLMVLAAVWFYVLLGLYAVYRPMRLPAAIYERWPSTSRPGPSASSAILRACPTITTSGERASRTCGYHRGTASACSS